jgi:hypothetical protein
LEETPPRIDSIGRAARGALVPVIAILFVLKTTRFKF